MEQPAVGVLITGGEGTRLRPLTYAVPKRCAPIGNVPVQVHMCRWLAGAGLTEVRVGTSSREAPGPLPSADQCGLERVVEVREPAPLGTGGFLRLASAGLDGLFVAANGDVITDLDVRALLRTGQASGADLVIAVRQVSDPSRFGLVDFDELGCVRRFSEKPERRATGPGFVNAGVYAVSPRALQGVDEGCAVSLEREVIPRLLESGRTVLARDVGQCYWVDVGTRDGYLEANRDCAFERGPLSGVGRHCSGYLAEEDAIVHASAAVIAGSCLGPRCVVESNAYVGGSVLLSGVRVGAGASVVDSVVGPDAAIAPGADVRSEIVVATGARDGDPA